MKPEPKEGELNEEYGFIIKRPFHIVSDLSSHRYLDLLGSNLVIKVPNGFDTQVFWFDQKTKTIKSEHDSGLSFDIKGAGSTQDMQMWTTNSGWFQIFRYQGGSLINV